MLFIHGSLEKGPTAAMLRVVSSYFLFVWTSYLHLCGQVIYLMMSVLSQKIYVLIVSVCGNGSNERSS
jgi:hypothetical protein